jgi:uncharacterized protein (TIGR02001 family)
MKKVIAVAAAFGIAAMAASAGTSVSVDIASAYVYRGITVVDDLVVQPGIEVDGFGMPEEYGSIAIGAWGSTAPFEDTYNNLHETDWYVVYALPEVVTNLDLSIGLTEYQYAGGAGEQEINLGAAFAVATNFTIGGSINFMIDDEIAATEDQIYIDFFGDYAIEVSEEMDVSLGALVSFMKQGDGNDSAGLDDGLNHFELTGAFTYALSDMWSLGASLAYIGQIDDDVLPDNTAGGNFGNGHERELVAMFSVGCSM